MFKITTLITWLNGISALMLVCTGFIYVILSLRSIIKTKNKFYLSGLILGLSIGLGWMGITLSFLSVAIYGYNLSGLKLIVNAFSYSTIPIGSLAVLSISWDLLMPPKHKKKVIIGVGILAIVYYIILFATFDRAIVCPDVPPGEIYDDWLSSQEILYYIVWILVLANTVIFGIGIIKFSKAVAGDLRKRAIYIIISTPIIGTCILLDTVIFNDVSYVNLLFIARFLLIPGLLLSYVGFRPSQE